MTAGGGASSYLATRKGLSNYASWFAPPLMYMAVPWAIFYPYHLEGGPLIAIALVAVVCAAAGDVKNRWSEE